MHKGILILEVLLLVVGFISVGFGGALSAPVASQNTHISLNGASPIKITPSVRGNFHSGGYVKYTLDLLNNTLLNGNHNTIGNGLSPKRIAFDPSNGNLYVTNCRSNNVSVISGTTGKVIGAINVGRQPRGIAFDSSNGNLYVANFESSFVSVINGTTNKAIGSIPVGSFPSMAAFVPSNGNLYIANCGSNNVSVINGATDKVTGSINLGRQPKGIAFDQSNGNLYIANLGSGNVSIINVTANKAIGSISVRSYPIAAAFDSLNRYVYVTNLGSNTVSVINGTTNKLIENITVGSEPRAVTFDSLNGNVYVDNSNSGTISIITTSQNYATTFTESGLPSGTAWYVNLTSGFKSGAIKGTSYSLSLVNGSYNYTIATADSNYSLSPSSGSLNVNGSSVSTPVTFSFKYKVTFTESGLPSGTTWYLNLSTGNFSSTSSTISVSLINGSYSYTVGTTDKIYHASGGSFSVNGNAVQVPIAFSKVKYTVTFNETGLPSGTTWYANITGQPGSGAITGSSYTVSLINGSYSYTVQSQGKLYHSSPGSFTVKGSPVPESVTFSEVKYTITFMESDLPSGTWYVNLSNGMKSGAITGSTYSFSLINGSYSYTISTSDKIYEASPSSFAVNGSPVSEPVAFSEVVYKVTFTESNLPSGTAWYVNLSNGLKSGAITGSSYSFSLINGSYSYNIATNDKIYHADAGSITVNGKITSKQITFSKFTYTVTFTETGLKNGTRWNMTFNGSTSSSNGTTITFNMVNGTYSYRISNVSGYSITNGSGSISVNGANMAKNVKYKSSPPGISSVELYAIVGAAVAVIAAAGAVLYIRKK